MFGWRELVVLCFSECSDSCCTREVPSIVFEGSYKTVNISNLATYDSNLLVYHLGLWCL